MSMIMHRESYTADREPRARSGDQPRFSYLATNRHDLTTTLIAGEVLRNHRIPVFAEGHGFVVANARPGQIEEALGYMNTGNGFQPETAEGCPI
jgi:hypothetical protein